MNNLCDTVFCVFHTQTDGYTYSTEYLVGIYRTRDEADTALLTHIEEVRVVFDTIAEIEVSIKNLWQDTELKNDNAEFIKQLENVDDKRKVLSEINENRPIDPNLDNYTVRQVDISLPIHNV